jgi:hypothetical protein
MRVLFELDCDGYGNFTKSHDHASFSEKRHTHVPCMDKETVLTTETSIKGNVLQ